MISQKNLVIDKRNGTIFVAVFSAKFIRTQYTWVKFHLFLLLSTNFTFA